MKTLTKSHLPQKQSGAALAISLMLLLMLTMVAVSSMDGSILGFKMTTNTIYHEQAFNNSESVRDSVGNVLVEYMFEADWDDVVFPTSSMNAVNNPDFGAVNPVTEKPWETSTLQTDLEYNDATTGINGEVAVFRGETVPNTKGAGAAQYKGYSGAGTGMGSQAGVFKYFEFRTEGYGTASANSWTSSDFRFVP